MQLNKLKGKIREKGQTYKTCANALGITTQAFEGKINGRTRFFVLDAETLGNFLGMTDEEKIDIFLN